MGWNSTFYTITSSMVWRPTRSSKIWGRVAYVGFWRVGNIDVQRRKAQRCRKLGSRHETWSLDLKKHSSHVHVPSALQQRRTVQHVVKWNMNIKLFCLNFDTLNVARAEIGQFRRPYHNDWRGRYKQLWPDARRSSHLCTRLEGTKESSFLLEGLEWPMLWWTNE